MSKINYRKAGCMAAMQFGSLLCHLAGAERQAQKLFARKEAKAKAEGRTEAALDYASWEHTRQSIWAGECEIDPDANHCFNCSCCRSRALAA